MTKKVTRMEQQSKHVAVENDKALGKLLAELTQKKTNSLGGKSEFSSNDPYKKLKCDTLPFTVVVNVDE